MATEEYLPQGKFTRCDEDDPRRCQDIDKSGQCPYLSEPGLNKCVRHASFEKVQLEKAAVKQHYKFKYNAQRISELSQGDAVKDLREEIGVIKMMIEEFMNQIKSVADLMLYSDRIASLIEQGRKLIESSQKLEMQNSQLLGRDVVIVIGQTIVGIVAQHVTDPDALDEIGEQILESISNATRPAYLAGVNSPQRNSALPVGFPISVAQG